MNARMLLFSVKQQENKQKQENLRQLLAAYLFRAGGMTVQDLVAAAKQNITEINVAKAKQLIAEGNMTIIDTREESEYAAGHLDQAVLLPRGVLEFKIGNMPELADKSKAVLIYCRTGGRAALAAQSMKTLGYTNVLSMAGGYEAWQKGG